MKAYSRFGFTDFVLALGYKGNVIKDYFLSYEYYSKDFTITLGEHKKNEAHGQSDEANWSVTLVDTGEDVMTGARVKHCEKYIDGEEFMLTYGDGLANINIDHLTSYHRKSGKIGTLIGVNPPSRFGELEVEDGLIKSFSEKPEIEGKQGVVNGVFMIFKREFFNYLSSDKDCILERKPLESLAKDRELTVYSHDGFWQCMDTYRDYLCLQDLWKTKNPPWLI